jgi:hypothetical protein
LIGLIAIPLRADILVMKVRREFMSKKLGVIKLLICITLLGCNISIQSALAAQNKEDIDVEVIKVPPRDVKDILLVLKVRLAIL